MSQNRVSVNFVNGEEIVSASFTILADLKKFVAGSHNRRASNVIVMDMNHSVLEDDNMPPPSNVIVVLQEMLDEGVENAFDVNHVCTGVDKALRLQQGGRFEHMPRELEKRMAGNKNSVGHIL
eukprot:GEMP01069341.1.p1 GENE.GEMP01069341.1~~GEMP01069341.1.p1  ORF type:complete len:123 (+),score=38.60 GEMP01069341.1:128-496(+)